MSIQKKVIILNGPPYSGKDTGALHIGLMIAQEAPWLTPKHNKFSKGMKEAVHKLYGLFHSPDVIDKQKMKDERFSDLLGQTPREAYIEMFKFLQTLHGEDVLGRLMEQEMRRQANIVVHICSDGGRPDEIGPIIEYVGAKNVLIIEVSSAGCTFENDVRSFIGNKVKEKYPKVTVNRVENIKSGDPLDLELYRAMVWGLAKKFLGI